MIHDQQVQLEVAREWAAVRKLCAGSHRQHMVAAAGGGVFVNETPPESFYNLPFLLAYAVLDQVLAELVNQGTIQCSRPRPLLGERMGSSKTALPWQNYGLVEAGKTARNELAHDAKLLGKDDCFAFIDAIDVELRAWSVL